MSTKPTMAPLYPISPDSPHYQVLQIMEDVDYGCEERPDVSERQVIMLLKTDDNQILQMRQPDFLMAQRKIQEGDSVCLIGGFLQKPIVSPCTIQYYETEIPVKEYVKDYVDIPTFLSACKTCPNYGTVWSCPPYSFDVSDFWMKYQTLKLYSSKIIFPESALLQTYRPEEIRQILDTCLFPEKQRLSDRMMELEKQYPGSVSLSAGACSSCPEGCSRADRKPCRFPDSMRYSVESLGGNVGLTVQKLLHLHLEWIEENRLPHHFILVNGLLLP